jgi:hypothetical protein
MGFLSHLLGGGNTPSSYSPLVGVELDPKQAVKQNCGLKGDMSLPHIHQKLSRSDLLLSVQNRTVRLHHLILLN